MTFASSFTGKIGGWKLGEGKMLPENIVHVITLDCLEFDEWFC